MSRNSKQRRMERRATERYESSGNGTATLPNPAIPRGPNVPRIPTEAVWREAPGGGRAVIEHVDTFVGRMTSLAMAYFNPDEAYQQNKIMQRGMLLDPVIRAPLATRINNVALLEWAVKAEDDRNKAQKARCDQFTKQVRAIPYFTKLRAALLMAIWHGRYGAQLRWAYGSGGTYPHPGLYVAPGGNMPNGWLPTHGDKFRVNFDDGRLGLFVRQGTHGAKLSFGDEARIEWLDHEQRQCFIYHAHEIVDGDYFDPKSAGSVMGLGLRHILWWTWWFKQNHLGWIEEFAQRVASGITVIGFEDGNDNSYKAAKKAAEEMGAGSIILAPILPNGNARGGSVTRIEPSTAGAEFLVKLLQGGFERQIKLMIAGELGTSEGVSTGLGSSIGDRHGETKNQYQQYDAANLDETLTRDLLTPMMNFPVPWTETWTPRFESAVSKPDPQQKSQAARDFYDLGGSIVEDELRDDLGLRKPRKGEKTLSKAKEQPPGQPGMGGPPGAGPDADGGQDDAAWLQGLLGDEGGAEGEPIEEAA